MGRSPGGCSVFGGATLAERYPQVALDPRPVPDDVPAEVGKALLAGLERRPADRPTPREVAEACEPVLARLPAPRLAGWRS